MLVKRSNREKNREIRHCAYGETARLAIGDIYPGMEIYGLTKGDISLVNIIEEVLKQTGKADVVCCTWAASGYDVTKLHSLSVNENIGDFTFILDFTARMKLKNTGFDKMVEYFPRSVYLTRVHSKFVVIHNEKWNIAIRTSMNLNENKRMENFEISDWKVLCDYLLEISKDIVAGGEFQESKFKALGCDEKYDKFRPKAKEEDIDIHIDINFDELEIN